MSAKKAEAPREHVHHQGGYVGSPSAQQMRTVGRRRRDAEEKLEHHLEKARHKDGLHREAAAKQERPGTVDSLTIAGIQNDDGPT